MSKMMLVLAAAMLLAGAAVAQTSPVSITNAWARATPAGAQTGAAYLTVEAAAGDRVTGVSTPLAGKAELHEMKEANGIMTMHPLAALDLPAGKPVILKPGAVHIMLRELKRPLRPGDHFPLTLDFAKAGEREVNVTVEGVGAMGPNGAGQSGMPMPAHH